ncbi:hypothetical protein H9Q69_003839 [Fusarium xylarioides]|uniref:Uncharacterized protein n=1 Tax=Fusarium xylarioides TaxID=221167 RepID=A0A9P7LF65_9HYPO|nr:hypothetical protein H9Q70_010703 [Fusarium xylarioides]KAG5759880.1 hypothetical protein H9Q72_011996 [Fusarium xylarioides]KAG5778606.1 hypothetical protein H9Q73_007747 [Fusarium xylarioides]KAG5797084.1 hypothetical protein H9Q69_003839 [Fusarium xylarioides]KAG5804989.1 hypothetical protein H9Q71_010443 [Fusarium xylarioides]
MRLSFGLILLFFVVNALAGGIRGAYERMYVWYAYQANIDLLENGLQGKDKLSLDNLDIYKGQTGSGRHGTMTFKEFIGFTNRDAKGRTPSLSKWRDLPDNNPPYYDRTAQALLDKKATAMWFKTEDIVEHATSYTKLLPEAGGVVYGLSNSLPGDNSNIRKALVCIGQVEKTRQVDFDRYRIPAMKDSPEFKDYKIEPLQLVLGTKQGSSTAVLDLDVIAQDNNVKPADFKKKVKNWENKTYFTDPANGSIARKHFSALKSAKQAVRIAETGSC